MGQITVFSGVERWRQWSDEQKLGFVAAAFAPGAVVAEIARAADLSLSLIYHWRWQFGGGQFGGDLDAQREGHGFATVMVAWGPATVPASPQPKAAIVIEISGAVVRIAADAPAKLVTLVLRSLAR
jgi:transposase